MKFEELCLKDKVFPVERAIELVRRGTIRNAVISFGKDGGLSGNLFWTLQGETDDVEALATLSKEEAS